MWPHEAAPYTHERKERTNERTSARARARERERERVRERERERHRHRQTEFRLALLGVNKAGTCRTNSGCWPTMTKSWLVFFYFNIGDTADAKIKLPSAENRDLSKVV